jgi:hypothetical protein
MSDIPGPVLGDLELSPVQVLEQVPARAVLEDYVDVLRVLEDVNQPDDVRVLADLEDLDFSLLKLQLLKRHVFLLNNLDGHLPLRLLVDGELHLPELPFTKVLMNIIEILDGRVPHSTLDVLHPLIPLVLEPAVEHAHLIEGEYYLERV